MVNHLPEQSMINYMENALKLAEQGRFTVSPNPMVGCIIVKDNQIVGTGFHERAGEPHAEIHALKEAGKKAHHADVYVTLEPCCHYGRTPPCTEALIQAGVKRVFIACKDPNPLVAGKGIHQLNAAGIETLVGIKEKEALELNKIFFHFMIHQRPFVITKWAMSLDGKTMTHPEDSRIISDENCHTHAHTTRQTVDAILIGSKTALQDNPQLTVRHASITHLKNQPLRLILASQGNLPLDLTLLSDNFLDKTRIIVTESTDKNWIEKAKQKNITVWILPANNQKQIDLSALMKKLHQENITSLLVEGGEQVRNSFFRENLVDETQVYLSPVFIGDLKKKKALNTKHYQPLGESLYLVASLKP